MRYRDTERKKKRQHWGLTDRERSGYTAACWASRALPQLLLTNASLHYFHVSIPDASLRYCNSCRLLPPTNAIYLLTQLMHLALSRTRRILPDAMSWANRILRTLTDRPAPSAIWSCGQTFADMCPIPIQPQLLPRCVLRLQIRD